MKERTRKVIFWAIIAYISANLGFTCFAPHIAIAMLIWGVVLVGAIVISAMVVMLYLIFVEGPDT